MRVGEFYCTDHNHYTSSGGLYASGHLNEASFHGEHVEVKRPPELDRISGGISTILSRLTNYKSIKSVGVKASISCSNKPYPIPINMKITFKKSVPGVAIAGPLAQAWFQLSTTKQERYAVDRYIKLMSKISNLQDPQVYQLTNIFESDKFKKATSEYHDVVVMSVMYSFNIEAGNGRRACECGHKSTTTNGWIKHKSRCVSGQNMYKRLRHVNGANVNILYDKLEAKGLIEWRPVEMEPFISTSVYDLLSLANDGDLGLSGEGLIEKLDTLIEAMDDAENG